VCGFSHEFPKLLTKFDVQMSLQPRPNDLDCTPAGLIKAALMGDNMGGYDVYWFLIIISPTLTHSLAIKKSAKVLQKIKRLI
jgi:hypothetical protein